jgi:hypothetical protein
MSKFFLLIPLCLTLAIRAGAVSAQDQAPTSSPPPLRTPEVVAAEIERADTEYKTLLARENKLLDELRERGGATNVPAAIGNDAELAAKMKKAREMEKELLLLKNEIREKMLANPALKEHREKMDKARLAIEEIQKNKMDLALRRKRLLDEKQALQIRPPTTAETKKTEAR